MGANATRFATHLTVLLDPGRWDGVAKHMRSALADLGLRADAIDADVQRNYCEEHNMLLDQHLALHDVPPAVEEIHLVEVRCSGEVRGGLSGVAAERAVTGALVSALPEGTGWYGTTVAA